MNIVRLNDTFAVEATIDMKEVNIDFSDAHRKTLQLQMAENDFYKMLEAMEEIADRKTYKGIDTSPKVKLLPNFDVEIEIGDIVLSGTCKEAEEMINSLCQEMWLDRKTYEEMADLAEARESKIEELKEEIRTLREENTDLRLGRGLLK